MNKALTIDNRLRNALTLAYHPHLKPQQRIELARHYGQACGAVAHIGWSLSDEDSGRIQAWQEATELWLSGGSNRHVLTWGQPDYPERLSQLTDPPLILFAEGDLTCLQTPAIAMVGSRNASNAGLENAYNLSAWLSHRGWCIVSGLAAGIDGAAHRGALSVNGATVAVMGTGIDTIYPREHANMARQLVDQGGLLLSEYPPGTPPRPAFFPRRNRIIAGLCHGLVVVEAALKSGSLITAHQANQAGRVVMAVPGSIHSTHTKGCHLMIRKGAILVENGLQIEEDTLPSVESIRRTRLVQGVAPVQSQGQSDNLGLFEALVPMQQDILRVIGFDPTDLETIVQGTELTAEAVLAEITLLELEGWITPEAGQRWCRFR